MKHPKVATKIGVEPRGQAVRPVNELFFAGVDSQDMPCTIEELNTFIFAFVTKHDLGGKERWMAPANQKLVARLLKGKRVSRDPDEPKRGRSGWQLFLHEQRPIIKAEQPDVLPKDILTISSGRWRDMADKSRWDDLSRQEVARQEELITAYKRRRTDESAESPDLEQEAAPGELSESIE